MLNHFPWLLPFKMSAHNLRSRLARTVLTVFGICLGVAVVLAIEITNKSTLDTLEQTFQRAVGQSELMVVPAGSEEKISEELAEWIRDVPGVRLVSAVTTVRTFLPGESPGVEARWGASGVEVGQTFVVQGIDPEVDPAVRIYYLAQGRMPAAPGYEAVITNGFAQEQGLSLGDDLAIATPQGIETLEVVGLLKDEGAAAFNNGKIAFAPLDVVQAIFGLGDEVDEIAVQVQEEIGSDPKALENLKKEVSLRLQDEAQVIYPAARGDLVPRMLSSYQLGLSFFSIIAVFVGAFLIYNTFSMTIAERTQEIGMLRAIGMERRQVFALVMSEASILAAAGSILGIGAGFLLSRSLVGLLSENFAQGSIALTASWQNIVKSAGIGVLVSFVAAFLPAYRAAHVSALQAIRIRGQLSQKVKPVVWGSGLALLVIGWVGLYRLEWREQVLIQAGTVSFFFVLLGGVLTVPLLIGGLERVSRILSAALYRSEGVMGSANVHRSVMRTTMTVACLMIALVMIIGIGTLSNSLKRDVQGWVNSALGGDLYVIASDPLQDSFAAQLQQIPGVRAVSPTRQIQVRVGQATVTRSSGKREKLILSAIDPDRYRAVGDIVFASEEADPEASWAELKRGGAVFISSVVADEYGLQEGDEIVLATRRGEKAFRVAAIMTDFSGQGYVLTGTYEDLRRWFLESGANRLVIALDPGTEINAVSDEIEERFQKRYHLDIQSASTIKASVMEMMDQSFMLFEVLSLIGVIIGALGIINTLTMNVFERKREIGGLRSLGMTRGQVIRMVLAEALALGVIGCIYGLVFGYEVSKVFVFALSTLSSYRMAYAFTLQPYWVSLMIALGVSQLAAFGPARHAASVNIVEAIKHE